MHRGRCLSPPTSRSPPPSGAGCRAPSARALNGLGRGSRIVRTEAERDGSVAVLGEVHVPHVMAGQTHGGGGRTRPAGPLVKNGARQTRWWSAPRGGVRPKPRPIADDKRRRVPQMRRREAPAAPPRPPRPVTQGGARNGAIGGTRPRGGGQVMAANGCKRQHITVPAALVRALATPAWRRLPETCNAARKPAARSRVRACAQGGSHGLSRARCQARVRGRSAWAD